MKKFPFVFLFLLCFLATTPRVCGQEIEATIDINTQKIEGTNKQVFEKLKTTLTEFINDHRWTTIKYQPKERIKCNFNIIVNKYTEANHLFECECYVQSTRPVYNAAYTTNTLQYRDKKFNFNFQEFDQLTYDDNHVDNNTLTALIAYYCYLIIGIDLDAMSPMGGTDMLQKAQFVVDNAQTLDVTGWKALEDPANRAGIITDLTSEAMTPLRQLQYDYYRKGLDQMADDAEGARKAIKTAIINGIRKSQNSKPLSKVPLFWTETKRDEIVNIFKGKGKLNEFKELYDVLENVNASQSSVWKQILN